MKEKNHNFFYELELELDHSIKNAFWADARRCTLMKNEDIQSFKSYFNVGFVLWEKSLRKAF
ncbi:hypothetical protein Ahy_A10g050370 [Arachis hypogaea]|uniref:Protein FAR1-RELATED SEQUENCE n=1 Tax=Arachis hypogaea TaxID=3818 RepID=A0A445B9A2_ARAHY|nr:hypothetical protein Ahy_A10g050370 [Arachis hypogaea]